MGYTTLESNIQSTWEGDDFVILRRRPINITACNLEFRIELRFAERMRWIAKDDADKYYIVKENLNYRLPLDTSVGHFNSVVQCEFGTKKLFKISDGYIYLSLFADWIFTNLNKCFDRVVQRPSTTVLAYSDLVESQIVGSEKAPLIREMHCQRTKEGTIYFEPLHLQWTPCRRSLVDVTEFEIAEKDGTLVELRSGKTVVVLLFKKG